LRIEAEEDSLGTSNQLRSSKMTVVAMVSADKPIIRICDLDQDEESADIVFATQADADGAVLKLNEIFKTATMIAFRHP
jgi:hypothetical protein